MPWIRRKTTTHLLDKALLKTIGANIKKHRRMLRMTQMELGQILIGSKYSGQYVWMIENGRINITIGYLSEIARVLCCDLVDLIVWHGYPEGGK